LNAAPRIETLIVDLTHTFGTAVTFAGAAFRDAPTRPSLRKLKVARQGGIQKEGLETIVRLFPNLRALDVRGCFGLSLKDFAASMLEPHPLDSAACATTIHDGALAQDSSPTPRRPHHYRLRLRKLRRVVASYRRRVPKALNFIEYHCGNYGTVEARIAACK
jgi:hypothetical protein